MPPAYKAALARRYEAAAELFLLGKHDRALDGFKSIYEVDVGFRNVAQIVDDYYSKPKAEWTAKYEARFQVQQPPVPPKPWWRFW